MSKLFIELYLDQDVSVVVAEILQSRGFAATTALESGRLNRTDEEQLEYAASHGFALLTHNRCDFEQLAVQWHLAGRQHYGIIIAVQRPAAEIVNRLLVILNTVTADEMIGQLRYI